MTRTIAPFLILLLTTTCASTRPVGPELGATLDQLAAEDRFSGVVLVARNGRPLFQRAYGMANREARIANRIDTRFNVGSMTKMFTAVAIAQLAERGKLSFDDPVGKHLPDFPHDVTIHQLLTHTSGLGDYHNDAFYARLNSFRELRDLVPLFASDPLSFEPGKGWDYSNAAFIVLGLIIEKVSGESYFDYVTRYIFVPAGMRATVFETNDRARGYMTVDEKRVENASHQPSHGSSAGGTYSTAGDLLRFVIALNDGTLLSKPYTQRVMSAKVKVPPGWPMHEYGYGFQMSTVDGVGIVGHGGAGPGIGAKLETYPDLGYTVIILSNYDLPAIMPVIMKSRELVLAAAKQ